MLAVNAHLYYMCLVLCNTVYGTPLLHVLYFPRFLSCIEEHLHPSRYIFSRTPSSTYRNLFWAIFGVFLHRWLRYSKSDVVFKLDAPACAFDYIVLVPCVEISTARYVTLVCGVAAFL